MSNIVFGPVTSRRFGQSLGIDLSPYEKQCNFDCVYCELKGAKPVDKIQNPPSIEEVVQEVKIALQKYKNLDVITFTANGEPTLYPYLEKLIDEIDKIKKETKTLILSNGANVLPFLKKLDIVKFSLDCVSEKCFKKIDRPLKSLHVKDIVENIANFRKEFDKDLIIEILVVKGINDKEEEFLAIKEALKQIKPNRIDVSTIDRPPAYKVEGVAIERLKELATLLGNQPVSIAYKRDYSSQLRDFNEEEILQLLRKRPQSFEDVKVSFSQSSQEILQRLLQENILHVKKIAGVSFYKIKEA